MLNELGHQLDETNTVATIGWASLLVFEFLTLEALVNLNDWKKPSKTKKQRKKRAAGGQRYDEVDEADEEQPRRAGRATRTARSPGRKGSQHA